MGKSFDPLVDLPGTKFSAPRPFWRSTKEYAVYLEEIMDWIRDIAPTEENKPLFYIYLNNNPGQAFPVTQTIQYYNPQSGKTDAINETNYKLPYSKYAIRPLDENSQFARVYHMDIRFFHDLYRQIYPFITMLSGASYFPEFYYNFTPGGRFTNVNDFIYNGTWSSNASTSEVLSFYNKIKDGSFLYNRTDKNNPTIIEFSTVAPDPPEELHLGLLTYYNDSGNLASGINNSLTYLKFKTNPILPPNHFFADSSLTSKTSFSDINIILHSKNNSNAQFDLIKSSKLEGIKKLNTDGGVSTLAIQSLRPYYPCCVKTSDNCLLYIDCLRAKYEGETTDKSFIGKYTVLDSDGTKFNFDGCNMSNYSPLFNNSFCFPGCMIFWKNTGEILITDHNLLPLMNFKSTKPITEVVEIELNGIVNANTFPFFTGLSMYSFAFTDDSRQFWKYSSSLNTYTEVISSDPSTTPHINKSTDIRVERPTITFFNSAGASPTGGGLYWQDENWKNALKPSTYPMVFKNVASGTTNRQFSVGGYSGNGVQFIYNGTFILDTEGDLYGFSSADVTGSFTDYSNPHGSNGVTYLEDAHINDMVAIYGKSSAYGDYAALSVPYFGYNFKKLFQFKNDAFDSSNMQMTFCIPPHEMLLRIRPYFNTTGFYSLYENNALKHRQNLDDYGRQGLPDFGVLATLEKIFARFLGNVQLVLIGDPFTTQSDYNNFVNSTKVTQSIDETLESCGIPPLVFNTSLESKYITITKSDDNHIRIKLANYHKPFIINCTDNYKEYTFDPDNSVVDNDGERLINRITKTRIKVWPRTMPISRASRGFDTQMLMFGNIALNFDPTFAPFSDYDIYYLNLFGGAPNSDYTSPHTYLANVHTPMKDPQNGPIAPFPGIYFKKTGTYDMKFSIDLAATLNTIQVFVWDVSGLPTDNKVTVGNVYNLAIDGTSSYPHTWYISDPTKARLDVDVGNTAKATLTILTPGTFYINVQDSAEIPWKSGLLTAT